MPTQTFLAGETVSLRPPEESDVPFVHAGVNHPAVRPHVGQEAPTSLDQERRYLQELAERDDAMALLALVDDEPVGVVELDPLDLDHGVAELAVWIHPDDWGHGYAREATALVISYVFDERRIHKVTAEAYETNEASRALFESLGFTQEGVGREDAFIGGAYHDTIYYGLLASEWTG